eukprot:UN02022
MPPLQTKIEGRGNGIKTVLMNIPDVAKHLHTEPSYATKFFGMEVGALSQYDHKRNVGIVHGVHLTKELQSMLKKFVKEFILCPKCKLPELQFKVHQKKNVLLQKCASCGWKGSNLSNHKVKTYIINHPPKKKDKANKKKGDKSGKSKKSGRRDKKNRKRESDKKEAGDGNAQYQELGWDNDEIWSVETSEDAVAHRKQKEMSALASKNKNKKGTDNDSIDKSQKKAKLNDDNSPPQILRNYVATCQRSNFEILDEVKRIKLARKFDQKKTLQLAIEALCKLDTLENFLSSMCKYKEILQTFTSNQADAKVFCGVLEEFVCRRNPDAFLGKVYKIFECLYDEDIVSEEDMLLWADLATDKAVIVEQEEAQSIRDKAKPFITWLRQNESDGDESDGDASDDDDEADTDEEDS